jgi:Leucine-rich repeat (LRR) protein
MSFSAGTAVLDLEFNDLTGTIPSELGKLTVLSSINLSLNLLTGQMPSELGMLINLQELTFFRNALTGTMPTTFVQMTSLRDFDVSSQVFEISDPPPDILTKVLTGPIPNDWSKCTSLERFNVEENFFSGTPPFGFKSANLCKIDIDVIRSRGRHRDASHFFRLSFSFLKPSIWLV